MYCITILAEFFFAHIVDTLVRASCATPTQCGLLPIHTYTSSASFGDTPPPPHTHTHTHTHTHRKQTKFVGLN